MLTFWKATSWNLTIGKLSVTLTTSNFQEVFVNKFNSSWLEVKILFIEKIYNGKTTEREAKMPSQAK